MASNDASISAMETQHVSKKKKMFFLVVFLPVVFIFTWANIGYAFQTLNVLPLPQKNFSPANKHSLSKMKPIDFLKKFESKSVFDRKLENLIQIDRSISTSA